MEINILRYIEGAKQAEGLTVIIDVFRAFSLECFLYDRGTALIHPVGSIEEAWALKRVHPAYVLIGERRGRKCEGFDFGNSPSAIPAEAVAGKTVLHTTSAGTQGIVNAVRAEEIVTGSLVNAAAVAAYIQARRPEKVSLVCMGNNGVTLAPEDELCAAYIKSILDGHPLPDLREQALALRERGGRHFFDPDNQEVFPEADFWACIQCDRFPFVLRVRREDGLLRSEIVSPPHGKA